MAQRRHISLLPAAIPPHWGGSRQELPTPTPSLQYSQGQASTGGQTPQDILGNAGPQGHFQPSNTPFVREVSSKSFPGKLPRARLLLRAANANPGSPSCTEGHHEVPVIPAKPSQLGGNSAWHLPSGAEFAALVFYPACIPKLELPPAASLPGAPPWGGNSQEHHLVCAQAGDP